MTELIQSQKWLTPPQLARQWGVAPEKIHTLIHSGQLEAVNLATNPNGRPRWRISAEAIKAFQQHRASKPPAPRRRRRRKRTTAEPRREFF